MLDHDSDCLYPANLLTRTERAAYHALIRDAGRTDEALLDEAFALAVRDLDDGPTDLRRLKRAHRHLTLLRHGLPSLTLADDLWFAGQLIARVLEVELGLDELEVVALFDAVGLPVDTVPHYTAIAELRTPHGAALGALASDLTACRAWPDDWGPRFDHDLVFDDEDDDLDHDD